MSYTTEFSGTFDLNKTLAPEHYEILKELAHTEHIPGEDGKPLRDGGSGRPRVYCQWIPTDDGEGIKPELLPHLFERFRQGDASTTRRHGGLGLGLSIVKHLIELNGGRLSLESQVGLGTTVTVWLPAAQSSSLASFWAC